MDDGFKSVTFILHVLSLYDTLTLSLSLSVVIGFARHRVASAREISARPRSDHSDS